MACVTCYRCNGTHPNALHSIGCAVREAHFAEVGRLQALAMEAVRAGDAWACRRANDLLNQLALVEGMQAGE